MKKVEDIFYNDIIPEAATGYIDCDFFVPICFGTKELRDHEVIDITTAKEFNNTMIPTLLIKNRDYLSDSINEYVRLAMEFYSDDHRLQNTNKKEKYIISSLLANTLVTDFNDISLLFDRHKNFMIDQSLANFFEPQNIGYSEILKSNVIVSVDRQSIVEETPYGMNIFLEDENNNILYGFPTIRFGISNDKAYIYAVQGHYKNNNKKIERVLRKIGEGFDEKNSERDPIENPENLYSVSAWSIVALSIAIPIIKSYSKASEFLAPYFLINRWNAPEISYITLKEKYHDQINNPHIKSVLDKKEQLVKTHDDIQRNITDKFIRNFRRLDHHFSNINIEAFQLDMDSSLHFSVDEICECNNTLLGEVYTLAASYKDRKTNIKR